MKQLFFGFLTLKLHCLNLEGGNDLSDIIETVDENLKEAVSESTVANLDIETLEQNSKELQSKTEEIEETNENSENQDNTEIDVPVEDVEIDNDMEKPLVEF